MKQAAQRGRVAVIGAGPGGMAAALSMRQAGHDVTVYERYPHARPAGNVLNLWPPPIKALGLLGVDIDDFGAPCRTQFRNSSGRVRVDVNLPDDIAQRYGGGFIGLLRPDLYRRLLDALPTDIMQFSRTVERFDSETDGVTLHLDGGETVHADVLVGADGIDSLVRRTIWGAAPKREHHLHIIAGYVLADFPAERGWCVVSHNRTTQASWTAIRDRGVDGFQWWVLSAHPGDAPFTADLLTTARRLVDGFAHPFPRIIDDTDPAVIQRWVIRDRPPLKQWSAGRVTLVGDAAHPTSPYAAYGAGMATEDGYFLGRLLAGVDLRDNFAVTAALTTYEKQRKSHTARQSQTAYALGQLFHHTPRVLRPVRDLILDHTPLMQKVVGEGTPREIYGQLALIDEAEQRFRTTVGSPVDQPTQDKETP